jgi:hypothetical protein
MARARITLHGRTAYLTVRDRHGRVVHTDNTGVRGWHRLIDPARADVAALNHIERIGHRTRDTWQDLVDKAGGDI